MLAADMPFGNTDVIFWGASDAGGGALNEDEFTLLLGLRVVP